MLLLELGHLLVEQVAGEELVIDLCRRLVIVLVVVFLLLILLHQDPLVVVFILTTSAVPVTQVALLLGIRHDWRVLLYLLL